MDGGGTIYAGPDIETPVSSTPLESPTISPLMSACRKLLVAWDMGLIPPLFIHRSSAKISCS